MSGIVAQIAEANARANEAEAHTTTLRRIQRLLTRHGVGDDQLGTELTQRIAQAVQETRFWFDIVDALTLVAPPARR